MKLLSACIIVLCIPSETFSQGLSIRPVAVDNTGLLASYTMTTGADASGNNRNLTPVNVTTAPDGKYSQAQRFNGTSSRMWINITNQQINAFTLEAWVYFNPVTTQRTQGPQVPSVGLRSNTGGWQGIIYKDPDDIFLAEAAGFLTMGFTSTTGVFVQAIAPSHYAENTWIHVAAVYNGSKLILYQNGLQVAEAPGTGLVRFMNSPMEFGGSQSAGGWLNGMIDNVRIYSRALSPTEVNTNMNTPIDIAPEKVDSWLVEVFSPGSDPLTGNVIASGNFKLADAMCNLTPVVVPIKNVINPTTFRVNDPMNIGKECEVVSGALFSSVPLGVGYFSTASSVGITGSTSARSPKSNLFDHVAVSNPPAVPNKSVIPSEK